jgi:hypothetical protein
MRYKNQKSCGWSPDIVETGVREVYMAFGDPFPEASIEADVPDTIINTIN